MMTNEQIQALQRGDIVRHAKGEAYIVLDNDGRIVTAIRHITVSNPSEWTLVKKHDWLDR